MCFSEAYEDFLEYAKNRHKKQGFETLSRNFNLHILPYFKDRIVNDLKTIDIINWQNIIYSKNYSNSFNNSLYCAFSSFIKYCVYCGYLKENIVLKTDIFKKKLETQKYDVYNLFEFLRFRRHLDLFVHKQFFTFMFFYGTRPSEAMALQFRDFKKGFIYIRHNIHRRGKRLLDTPKNASSVRFIKLSYSMRFRIWLLKKYYFKVYGSFNNDYFIFGGLKPLSTTTLDRYKSKACSKAHLRVITQHQFRHSFATRMINKHVSIARVSKIMGHSKISTTLDVYVHFDKEKRIASILSSQFD